ncbi:MAG: hypothetical protein JW909_06195 [Planctomycetes bacterium]|nr:hypothetical protein [Planctomycetota bacterium]
MAGAPGSAIFAVVDDEERIRAMRTQKELLEQEGIIYTGFWEPIHFFLQRGVATQNTASSLDFIKSEDYIRYLADIGVNQLWSNFSKGYGLAFENEEQEKIRRMNDVAGKYNMRTIAYCTGGSLTPETVKYDFPGNPEIVEDMLVRRADGKYASYGNGSYQMFRARPDYTSPDYMEWQKRVVKKALDFGCDGIHFDNTNILPEPARCRCPRCLRMWREFLAEKYDVNDPEKKTAGLLRWGRTDFRFAKEPWYDEWNHPVLHREVHVANAQDWLLFQQKIFCDALGEWADYIHELGGMVEYNCGKGFNQNYRGYGSIVDEILLEKADIVFNEGTLKLGYNEKGSPHTRIRSHKVVQAFDIPMMNYNSSTHMMAEAFSFNPGMCGMWDRVSPSRETDTHGARRKFFAWYHKNKLYQTKQVSIADVGVFLHHESMTFSMLKTYMHLCSLTQLLQEEKIAFRFLYEKDLDGLDGLRLVLVPDAYCLKERQARKLADFVLAGGSMLTSGRTGERDDFFRVRTAVKEVKSFEDFDRAGERENVFTFLTGRDHQSDFIMRAGDGMVAHISELEHEAEPDPGDVAEWCIRPALINRPRNSTRVMDFLNRLYPERLLAVDTAQDVAVDICRRKDTGEGLVHVFNVSWCKGEKARAAVSFKWPEPVRSLTWIAWNRDDAPVRFKAFDGGASFKLDGIEESAVIVVNKR